MPGLFAHAVRFWVLFFAGSFVCLAAPAQSIRLNTGTLDTGRSPATAKNLQAVAGPEGKALALVQFAGPIEPGWRAAIEQAGAKVHFYVPDYAYLVTLAPERVEQAAKSTAVRWVGTLPVSYKVSPELRKFTKASTADKDSLQRITILSVDDAPAQLLASQGIQVESSRISQLGWHDTRAAVPQKAIDRLARVWSVFYIEPTPEYELHGERGAQVAAGNYAPGAAAPTGPGYGDWLASQGLEGAPGVIVQVQDDGLDQGNDSNEPGTAHPDLLGGIAGIFNATSDPLGDSTAGHGQINAGIIMGRGAGGTTDADGYLLGQGMAPQAQVYGTKIFSNFGFFDIGNNSFDDLAKAAQDAGATFSSNSWGSRGPGVYTADSAEFDALVRDADPTEPGNQPMTYFFSAGNDGPTATTLGAPGTAKNVIAVGAGENSDADGTDGCLVDPSGADSMMDLIDFSSRGPAGDGRQGVTLFSVGTHVQGPASTAPLYDGTGVCDAYWPSGQTLYARSSGTSHSCPMACGAGMIVHEFFNRQLSASGHTATPSPALIKAVLANTATDMAGGEDGAGGTMEPVPNPDQGWGSVNLSTLLENADALYSFDQEEILTASGIVWEQLLTPVSSAAPLKITLAWSDAPASPLANPVQVNDLDLVVTDGTTTYLGNVFANGMSTTGGTADRLNNLEAVYIANPTGPVTVQVIAHNIAGDGVPNVGGAVDQDFALFAWNATDQSDQGIVKISPAIVPCEGAISVTVSDTGLQGAGAQSVLVSSSNGDSEIISVSETPSGSGVLVGSVPLEDAAVVAGDGKLQVAADAGITVTYEDTDDGSGSPATVTDEATVDCVPPEISNVIISAVTHDSATINFETSEPSQGRVADGESCGDQPDVSTGTLGRTSHTIKVTGLFMTTEYFFSISAQDIAGNIGVDDNGGACYRVTTLEEPGACPGTVIGNGGFESGTFDAWTTTITGGAPYGGWEIASTGGGYFGNGRPHTGDWYAQNHFAGETGATFDIYREVAIPAMTPSAELQWADRVQWDTTYGATQSRPYRVTVQPAGGGAPLAVLHSFDVPPNTTGDTDWQLHTVDLLTAVPGIAGTTVRLNWQQLVPDYYTGPGHFALDSVCLIVPSQTRAGTITLDQAVLQCADDLRVQVSDADLQGAGSIDVDISSSLGDVETLRLEESPAGSGFFSNSLAVMIGPMNAEDGILQAAHGAVVTAIYEDTDDGTGSPATAVDTAELDCQAPAISEITIENLKARSAEIHFTASELSRARVRYSESCATLSGSAADNVVLLNHVLLLAELRPSTTYFFAVEAEDAAGNIGMDNNGGDCFSFTTPDQQDYFTATFGGSADPQELELHSLIFEPAANASQYTVCTESRDFFPVAPEGGTFLSLGDDGYQRVDIGSGKSAPFYGDSYTSFYVGSNGYITFGGGDTSYYGDLGSHFELPRISAFYTDLISSASHVSWRQLSDRMVVTWDRVTEYFEQNENSMQVELFFNGMIRITLLEIEAPYGVVGLSEGDGYPADFEYTDFAAYGPCLFPAGTITLNADVYPCSGEVYIEVRDADLRGTVFPTVNIMTRYGDAEQAWLLESAPNSGIFRGTLPLVPGLEPTLLDDTLQVQHGDTLTARYVDEDDGTGDQVIVIEEAMVDCVGPAISQVQVAALAPDSATVTFRSSEPATGTVRYGTACEVLGSAASGSTIGPNHSIVLNGLLPETEYFFSAAATDNAGNQFTDENGGSCYTFTTPRAQDTHAEGFSSAHPFDLEGISLRFVPEEVGYHACRQSATTLPTPPEGGTPLGLGDDGYTLIHLPSGATLPFFGVYYNRFYVGSNGYITFGTGDFRGAVDFLTHFTLPRIAGLSCDLDPSANVHAVSLRQLSDRIAVTWQNVPQYGQTNSNTFQIEMFFNGEIHITHMNVEASLLAVGLSEGTGVPPAFIPTDLSSAIPCFAYSPFIVGGGLYELGDRMKLQVAYPYSTGAVTYQWLKDDMAIPDNFDAEYIVEVVEAGDGGIYQAVVTDESKGYFVTPPVPVIVVSALPISGVVALAVFAAIAAVVLRAGLRRRSRGQRI